MFEERMLERILTQKNIVDQALLEKAIDIKNKEKDENRPIAKILYDDLGVDREKVLDEIVEYYAIPHIREIEIDEIKERIEFISKFLNDELNVKTKDELLRNKAVPFSVVKRHNQRTLKLLTADPLAAELKSIVEKLHFENVEICYTSEKNIYKIYNEIHKHENELAELMQSIEYEDEVDASSIHDEELTQQQLEEIISKSALTQFVDGLLEEAVREGASDIHIIPINENTTEYKFRIDGDLQTWYTQKGIRPEAISAVFKDKTKGVNRFEREKAQDGFIQKVVDGQFIRYRVSIIPIVGSSLEFKLESIVIRILDDRKVIKDLAKLGLLPKALNDFKKAISSPSGIVIITGPTGSGKSTTLVAALYYVMDPRKCVLTVEDPVEYMIEGARQLKIGEKMDFNKAIRAILRHDPDIVLVGEMRDKETAQIGIKLANTGHLTFSTLHTNDAPSAVSRLFKMGVEPFLIANSINLVMAQRLVKKLCDHCKVEDSNPDPDSLKMLGFSEEEITSTTFYKPVGCEHCTGGYRGRTAIMEALYFTPEIRREIINSSNNIDEDRLREVGEKQGMLSLREAGRQRIMQGIASVEDILAKTLED
ncbi:MAG: type II/IV secretion system protein [Candidatus Marinimicrobia bacterium]|nr:type II/IV secretion system protein [Candidatus Neomarinimicrobiota bacterium]